MSTTSRPVSSLDDDHQTRLQQAVLNVLSTSLAQSTLAQVIEGLPTSEIERDKYKRRSISFRHPIHTMHQNLCPGAIEKLRELSGELDLTTMEFPAELMFDFNSLSPGSMAYNTRLIELVARAIHEIAATLFERQPKMHENDTLTSWLPSKEEDPSFWMLRPKGMPPTLLRHEQYTAYRRYPRGVADGVGYWAEGRIFGGVVLFDRRNPETDPAANPHDIYFHSDRFQVTYRIYALLDQQRRKLLDFFNLDHPRDKIDEVSPLPIVGDTNNRCRVDPEEPALERGIYRDVWERRKVPGPEKDARWARRDVYDPVNYTSWEEFQASVRRAGDEERAWYERDHSDESDDDE